MYTRVTKKALLLLATSLLLTGCTDNPENSASNDNSENDSNTSLIDSGSTDSENPTSDTSVKSSVDYTKGWAPAIDSEIRRGLGGHGLPFFDMTGEITIVHVDRTSTSRAHMLITSTCAYDRTLVYNAKTKFELAGWSVSYNNASDEHKMRIDAVQEEQGITVAIYGKPNSRDDSYYPAIECYFTEVWNEPVKGTNWSDNTISVLTEIGVQSPHMLPYVYMGAYNDTAEKKTSRRAFIKGGDWLENEAKILIVARKALSSGKSWVETDGVISGSGRYRSNFYTFTKTFSDGYKIEAKLYGDAADGSFDSTKEDDIVAYLDVMVTPKR